MSLLAARRHLATEALRRRREGIRTRVREWANATDRGATPLAMYGSHLERLTGVFDAACDEFATWLAAIALAAEAAQPTHLVQFEAGLLQLGGIFDLYANAESQRRDPITAPLLLAADEVIYAAARRYATATAGWTGVRSLVVPLPTIQNLYSPAAVPGDPGTIELGLGARAQDERLRALPVPLMWLTPSMAAAPWWLALLAHEMGHALQHAALPDRGLVGQFAARVVGTVQAISPPDAARWEACGEEIFADLLSALLIGGFSARILEEAACGLVGEGADPTHPRIPVRLGLLTRAVQDGGGSIAGFLRAPLPALSPGEEQIVAALAGLVQGEVAPTVDAPGGRPILTSLVGDGRKTDVSALKASLLNGVRPLLDLAVEKEVQVGVGGAQLLQLGTAAGPLAIGFSAPGAGVDALHGACAVVSAAAAIEAGATLPGAPRPPTLHDLALVAPLFLASFRRSDEPKLRRDGDTRAADTASGGALGRTLIQSARGAP